MPVLDSSQALPDAEALRPLAQRFWEDEADDGATLRAALCTLFRAHAAASIPVERALARVNRALDYVSRDVRFDRVHPRSEPLHRLVIACCLDCYYPPEPEVGSETVPA